MEAVLFVVDDAHDLTGFHVEAFHSRNVVEGTKWTGYPDSSVKLQRTTNLGLR